MKAHDTAWRWIHFRPDEFACSHCGAHGIEAETLDRLEIMRVRLAEPIIINSAYRCPGHPEERYKPRVGSHAHGRAVDVRTITAAEKRTMRKLAMGAGFTGFGTALRYLHIDDVQPGEIPLIRRPASWVY